MTYTIPIANQLSYRSIPRNKDLKLSITNHCDFPSRTLVVDNLGNCFVCACEAWLPITVGNILEFDHLQDVWNSPTATRLQQDINQGLFSECAVDRCGILHHDQRAAHYCGRVEQDPIYYISINIDESCNLQCPSCRPEIRMTSEGEQFDSKLSMVKHLVRLLDEFEPAAHLIMSGNGDPLASHIMRPLLHQWRARRNHTIRLFTNGLLLEKQLTDNDIVNNITQYFISIDAGSQRVYEHVRQPGRWPVLLRNFDWLRETVRSTGAHVLLKFVLQSSNYHDMENFIDLCDAYGFSGIINRLEDWGTWSRFQDHDVIGNIKHVHHQEAMDNLREVYARHGGRIQFNASLEELARG